MAKTSLSSPIPRRDETIVGFSWFGFQLLLLPSILTGLNGLLKKPLSLAEVNFTFFSSISWQPFGFTIGFSPAPGKA